LSAQNIQVAAADVPASNQQQFKRSGQKIAHANTSKGQRVPGESVTALREFAVKSVPY
jgi:hypothetical protein